MFIPSARMTIDASKLMDAAALSASGQPNIVMTLVSDQSVEGMDIRPGEARFTGSTALQKFLSPRNNAEVEIQTGTTPVRLTITSISKEPVLPMAYGQVLVVDDADFRTLSAAAASLPPQKLHVSDVYYGVILADAKQTVAANDLYETHEGSSSSFSQYQTMMNQRTNMGLIMFIVAFLGLTFLITSGCILYFKQMDESEEEKSGYTILRKLGFTPGDLLSGIRFKQLFNFGIPLVVGLSHSYFAVKSGWFFFGTEMLSPTILVMLVYTGLYSIFGVLSVLYYKRVIGESL
ncbi:Bacitracin export permease protein BceB [compost metagenome]